MSKIDYHHGDASNLQFRKNADTRYDDAENMFSCYGAHERQYDKDGRHVRDWEIQVVDAEWLRSDKDEEELVELLLSEDGPLSDRDLAEALAAKAKSVWDDMVAIEELLAEAVAAYERGDLAACLEALSSAGHAESDHGDDPSTSDLADRLLEPRVTFRVYRAPDGCDAEFVGEYDTQEEAEDAAEKATSGLPRSMWDTARAAGHVAGLYAPSAEGEEDEEPESWHGPDGVNYVVRVTY